MIVLEVAEVVNDDMATEDEKNPAVAGKIATRPEILPIRTIVRTRMTRRVRDSALSLLIDFVTIIFFLSESLMIIS